VDAAARLNPARLPVWTLLICAVAGAVYCAPPLQALLVYDRAAIGNGELWRLVTGNLVHHSASHFAYDVVPLLIAGTLIQIQRLRHFAALCVVASALIGAALYIGKPEIVVFGGLSGIVTAAAVFLCLHGLYVSGFWRWLCLVALACLAAKIGAEMGLGSSLLFGAEPQNFVPVPESHVVGAATALLLFLTAAAKARPMPVINRVISCVMHLHRKARRPA
jgi:rhomboid family GlyGly-CTERM serine protease